MSALPLSPAAPSVEACPASRTAADPGTLTWVAAGARRRWATGLVSLVCAWSGVWLAVWLLVADTVAGALLSAIGNAAGSALLGGGGPSPGSGALSVAAGALQGAAGGLASSVAGVVGDEPLQFLAALGGGLLTALVMLAAGVALEPWLLRLRGCRRPSRREALRLMPLLEGAAAATGLRALPVVLVADRDNLRVRAHTRHLVVGRGLIEEIGEGPAADSALAAVLAHGLHHWAAGDGVGALWLRCCGLPLVLVYDAGCRLAQQGNSLIALAGWLVLWPAWLLVRLVIQPVVALGSRRQEYAADAAVAAAGQGEALHRALSLLGELEPGRSGWDRVIAATHPPVELRLEALEPGPEA